MDAVKQFRNATEDWLGKFGEALWKRVFEASGIGYIPLCDIENGRAPAAINPTSRVVVPDFDAYTDEWSAYIDSKAKKQSVLWRMNRQVRHGIDRRSYDHYVRIGAMQKKLAGLGIVECFDHNWEWSGSLLIESLSELGEPIPGDYTQKHMCYWRRKDFRRLDSFTPGELIAIARGEKKVRFPEELYCIFGKKRFQRTFAF